MSPRLVKLKRVRARKETGVIHLDILDIYNSVNVTLKNWPVDSISTAKINYFLDELARKAFCHEAFVLRVDRAHKLQLVGALSKKTDASEIAGRSLCFKALETNQIAIADFSRSNWVEKHVLLTGGAPSQPFDEFAAEFKKSKKMSTTSIDYSYVSPTMDPLDHLERQLLGPRFLSFAVCPITVGGKKVGVLGISCKKDRPTFTDFDILALKTYASFLMPILDSIASEQRAYSLIAKLTDKKDKYTRCHSIDVAAFAVAAASALNMPPEDIKVLEQAGLAHDLGKVLVSSNVLWQPYHMDKTDFPPMTRHVCDGFDLLRDLTGSENVLLATLFHHWPFGADAAEDSETRQSREKWPYPRPQALAKAAQGRLDYLANQANLSTDNSIDKETATVICDYVQHCLINGTRQNRIVELIAISDAFSAMCSPRPYQDNSRPKTPDEIFDIIREDAEIAPACATAGKCATDAACCNKCTYTKKRHHYCPNVFEMRRITFCCCWI